MLKDVQGNAIDNPSLAMVETVCIAWFTLEYFIRYVFSFKMFLNSLQYFQTGWGSREMGFPKRWNEHSGCFSHHALFCVLIFHGTNNKDVTDKKMLGSSFVFFV